MKITSQQGKCVLILLIILSAPFFSYQFGLFNDEIKEKKFTGNYYQINEKEKSSLNGNGRVETPNEWLPGTILVREQDNVTFYELITDDFLSLTLSSNGFITDLKMDDNSLLTTSREPFVVADILNASSNTIGGSLSKIADNILLQTFNFNNIGFECNYEVFNNFIGLEISLASLIPLNASLDVEFSLPINASNWKWWDDLVAPRTITNQKNIYENVINNPNAIDFAHGKINRLPFALISNDDYALNFAIDFSTPITYLMGYDFSRTAFYSLFSLALSNLPIKIPGQALMRFIIYRSDPNWGLRSSADCYYNIYSSNFNNSRCLLGGHGFHSESIPREVGISYFQGGYNRFYRDVNYGGLYGWGGWYDGLMDEALGIKSLQYISGATQGEVNCTAEQYGNYSTLPEIFKFYQQTTNQWLKDYFIAGLNSFIQNRTGGLVLEWRDDILPQAWIKANPDPELGNYTFHDWYFNYWLNPSFYDNKLIGVEIDGIMADNQGPGYAALPSGTLINSVTDYNRDHFYTVDYPLTYSYVTGEPVINLLASCVENLAFWRQELTAQYGDEKSITANMGSAIPQGMFLIPYIDTLLMEAGFSQWGIINNETEIRLIRTLAYQKTICGLDYNSTSSEIVEQYIQRLLPYAIFPNAGGNWTRDIALYQKYIPIFRQLAGAGWEPITYGEISSNFDEKNSILERFGSSENNNLYFVLRDVLDNQVVSPTPIVTITLPMEILNLDDSIKIIELISGELINPIIQGNKLIFNITINDGESKAFAVFKPELTADFLTVYGKNPYVDNTVELCAMGTYSYSLSKYLAKTDIPLLARFFADDQIIGDAAVEILNETHWIAKITYQPKRMQMSYLLKVKIDPLNQLIEFLEDNNEKESTEILPFIWHYRIKLLVNTLDFNRDKVYCKFPLNFQEIFQQMNIHGNLDLNSLRIYSIDENCDIPCQFIENYQLFTETTNQTTGNLYFPIINKLAHTILEYYLVFDTIENGVKNPPVLDQSFLDVTTRSVLLNSDKFVIFSPLTGTPFKILEGVIQNANGLMIRSIQQNDWDTWNSLFKGLVTKSSFFWGKVIKRGPFVTRIVQEHATNGCYEKYGIITDIYANGIIDTYPFALYNEPTLNDRFEVHSLYWYPDPRNNAIRVGFYWNQTHFNLGYNSTQNFIVPKEQKEPWYGQKTVRDCQLEQLLEKSPTCAFVIDDPRFSYGEIATRGDRDWCYYKLLFNITQNEIITYSIRYINGFYTLDEITQICRNNTLMNCNYEILTENNTRRNLIIVGLTIGLPLIIALITIPLIVRYKKKNI